MSDPAFHPNVVLICVDQWRGDALGSAGHPVVETPYLDLLAQRGTRFARAYSAAPSCIPARAGLMTGLAPEHHGRVGYRDRVPWDYPVTLAGEFTRGGYQTRAIGKMHVFPERHHLGFEHLELHDGFLHEVRNHQPDRTRADDYLAWLRERDALADDFEHGLDCNSLVARPWDKPERLHPTNWVTQKSIEFLQRRDPTRPFFLFMSYHRPHPPYDPPRWAFEQYAGQELPEPVQGDWDEELPLPDQTPSVVGTRTRQPRAAQQRAQAGYYGHMTHIDHQVNRFLTHLQDERLHTDTVVCFVSDHGELMGDHGLYRKSLPYEGSARVPLLLSGPGIPSGQDSLTLAELRDLMPTLLDAARLPVPAGLDGHSLLPVLRGEAVGRNWLHGEHALSGQSVQWMVAGSLKYVWYSGEGYEQLFDLHADPQEKHNVARQRPADLAALRGYLIEALTGREEGYVQGGQLVVGCRPRATLSFLPDAVP